MNEHVQPTIRVQRADFDAAAEFDRIRAQRTDIGAVVTFTGVCRDEGGQLAALELEHYPGMAERQIARIASEAAARWPLLGLTVIHRFGTIAAGENIVLVVAASPHRGAAFEAAAYIMDFLKTDAPFWKREHDVDGRREHWVNATDQDRLSSERWKKDTTSYS